MPAVGGCTSCCCTFYTQAHGLGPKIVAMGTPFSDNDSAPVWLISCLDSEGSMPASLNHITPNTPMGANLIADGATFRVWAPHAEKVYVLGDFNGKVPGDSSLLVKDEKGHWRGFFKGRRTATATSSSWTAQAARGGNATHTPGSCKRLSPSDCIIRETDFPWHDTGYVTPRFHNFVIYQLHVGTFFTPRLPGKAGTFLDVARKVPYLAELGVTAIQLLPIQEFQTKFSLGYNGTDYFSPRWISRSKMAHSSPTLMTSTPCSMPRA